MVDKKEEFPEGNPARRSWEAYIQSKIPQFIKEPPPADVSEHHACWVGKRAHEYQMWQAQQQVIHGERLESIEKSLGGNSRPGLLDRMLVLEQKVKGAYFLLGLLVTAVTGLLVLLLKAGVFRG